MAKTAYGMRMYRARKARAQDMANTGAREFTTDASRGESILVEEGNQPDEYLVTRLKDGEEYGVVQDPYNSGGILEDFGVDVMKGQWIDGVTTQGYSEAMYHLAMTANSDSATKASSLLPQKVDSYLRGQTGESVFTAADVEALDAAMQHAIRFHDSDASGTIGLILDKLR